MSRRTRWTVSVAALVLRGSAAAAEDAAPPSAPTVAETVLVTATRDEEDPLQVPAAIDRVDAVDIQRAQPRVNLSESLGRVPGILARDRQNQAQDLQISIRGFGARATFGVRGVRLYTDGIPATMPDGQGQVSHFALDAADRIEVLRGPFSALYGNSSGGVIQLFGASPPSALELEAGLVSGGDGLRRGSLGVGGPWGHAGGYSLDLSRLESDGYRDHSEARRTGAQASLRTGFGRDGELVAIVNGLDAPAADPQGLTAAELAADRRAASPGALAFDTRKRTRQRQLGVRLDHGLAGAGRFALVVHAGNRAVEQMLSVPVAAQSNPLHGGGVVDLDRDYFGVDARWRWHGELLDRPFAITLGAEHQTSDERRRGFENFAGTSLGVRGALRRDEANRVTGFDQYLQAEWEPGERWRAHLGLRSSDVTFRSLDEYINASNPDDSGSLDFQEITPVLGLLWRATPRLSLYANAGEGFETPTGSELAYRSDGGSGLNSGLLPARSDNYEVGWRARRDESRFALALFRSETEGELVIAANQGGRSTFANAALSFRQGAELSWSGSGSGRWRYALAYTFLEASYRRAFAVCGAAPCAQPNQVVPAGSRIPGLPRHSTWAELRWLATPDLDVALAATALDRVYANDENSAAAPGFASIDLSGERRFRLGGFETTGFLRVNNVLDRDFVGSVIVNESNGRYFEPAPGRLLLAGVRATFRASPREERRPSGRTDHNVEPPQ